MTKLLNDTAYSEPDWHWTATFNNHANKIGSLEHSDGGYHLDVKNSAYLTQYNLNMNLVHAIYIVYKIRDYSKTTPEHNYLFNCAKDKEYHGVCLLSDRKTMRIYGVASIGTTSSMDISNFSSSYHNPCEVGKWNVLCIIYKTKHPKESAIWLNHGKLQEFTCHLPPMPATELNFFTGDFRDATSLDGYIGTIEIYPYFTTIPEDDTAARMIYLCERQHAPKKTPISNVGI